MTKILIGAPVRRKPEILVHFIQSLMRLNIDGLDVEYMFIDDNTDPKSSEILRTGLYPRTVKIIPGENNLQYVCDDYTHWLNSGLCDTIGQYRNALIEAMLEQDYDYLFLVDSDLVLKPQTLKQLLAAEKDIVSEIFWSKWKPDRNLEPNVWLFDVYDLVPRKRGETLTVQDIRLRYLEFLEQLKQPGLYKVGGLGACTLFSRKALETGLNYNVIDNLTFVGGDRHFCVRARVLGIELWVDTHCPAYHIYRDEDLAGVEAYIKE